MTSLTRCDAASGCAAVSRSFETGADAGAAPSPTCVAQPGVAATVVTHEELVVDAAPDWSYLAHLTASERQMLPACAATAHDYLEPYDAELQPVRAPR